MAIEHVVEHVVVEIIANDGEVATGRCADDGHIMTFCRKANGASRRELLRDFPVGRRIPMHRVCSAQRPDMDHIYDEVRKLNRGMRAASQPPLACSKPPVQT